MANDSCSFCDLKKRLVSASFLTIVGICCLLMNPFVFIALCLLVFSIMCYELFWDTGTNHIILKSAAIFICFLGICSLSFMRLKFGSAVCVYLICAASGADLGGYFVGKLIGGPKFCPKISPNKTVSGVIGAVFVANILCFFCVKYSDINVPYGVTQLVIVSSIIGDMFESKLKRALGVKDLGSFFPGHGGVLDRFDSLIFASISFFIYSYFIW